MCEHVNNSSKSIRHSESLERPSPFGCVFYAGMGMVVADDIEFFPWRYWDRRKFICFGACILLPLDY